MLKNYSQILKIWEEKPLCLLKKSLWALLQSTLKEGLAFAKTVQKVKLPLSHKTNHKTTIKQTIFWYPFPERAVTPMIILNACT